MSACQPHSDSGCALVGSMFKMPQPGHDHRQVMFAAIIDRVIIPDRTTGLYKGGDTGFMSQSYTIIKGEESIACHQCAMQVETELLCLLQGLAQGVDPAGLSAAFPDQLFILNEGNGI